MPESHKPPVACCKGSMILLLKKGMRRAGGESGLDAVVARCPPETAEILRGVVLSQKYYPEKVVAEFTEAACREFDPKVVLPMARTASKDALNTLFKMVLRLFVSPRKLTENNHKLWSAIHDSGRLEAEHGLDGCSKIIRVYDFDFVNDWYMKVFAEFHCGVLENLGLRNVSGHGRREPDGSYFFRFTWDKS